VGSVFDSGSRSGAVWGCGAGVGEPPGAACSAGEGDDLAAPGWASCARNAPSNVTMPSERKKNRVVTNQENQEILARERILRPLFRSFLTTAAANLGLRASGMLTAGSVGSQPRRPTAKIQAELLRAVLNKSASRYKAA